MLIKILAILCCSTIVASGRVPFYRRDYVYLEEYNAFYKLHLDSGNSWNSALLACDEERSTLFYPKTKDEWTIVKNLRAAMKGHGSTNVTEILIGIHDEAGMGEFMTVEGLPTPSPLVEQYDPVSNGVSTCLKMDVESGTYTLDSCVSDSSMAFVCKRVELPACRTIDHEYVLHQEINKCYKINTRQKTWHDAMHTCFMEGGRLAVIANAVEASIIKARLPNGDYFVGFRRLLPGGDFYTVKGQKIDNAFYQKWWQSENDDTKNDCGVARGSSYDILYTTTRDCSSPSPFVCEMTAV